MTARCSILSPLCFAAFIVIAAISGGCQKQDKQEVAATQFKDLCSRLMPRIIAEHATRSSTYTSEGKKFVEEVVCNIPNQYAVDVKKTDSVITPFEGVMEFSEGDKTTITANGEPYLSFGSQGRCTLRFGYQDGRWVFKSATKVDEKGQAKEITNSKQLRAALSSVM